MSQSVHDYMVRCRAAYTRAYHEQGAIVSLSDTHLTVAFGCDRSEVAVPDACAQAEALQAAGVPFSDYRSAVFEDADY